MVRGGPGVRTMMTQPRTGVWLVGGRGSVATTTMVGTAAIVAGAAPSTGLVTSRPPFAGASLPRLDQLVFGGHDLVATPLLKRAEALASAGVIPAHLLEVVQDRLADADARILLAPSPGSETPRDAVDRLVRDLKRFRADNDLGRIVVVNVASTEPVPSWPRPPATASELRQVIDAEEACPPSLAAAVAASEAGAAFVDFTPGAALLAPALLERATQRGVPVAGRDGKTGETLLKTALAPMFADRALQVRSWAGTNLLGGGDGARLADPVNAASKLESKNRSLEAILPDPVSAPVHIDHVPDLGEWKTAWNHIHFEGFLGTGMQLQFTWQGCDSALAAPLVLDLVRLTALALQRGDAGPLPQLGFFFKDPVASDEHRLGEQYRALQDWVVGA